MGGLRQTSDVRAFESFFEALDDAVHLGEAIDHWDGERRSKRIAHAARYDRRQSESVPQYHRQVGSWLLAARARSQRTCSPDSKTPAATQGNVQPTKIKPAEWRALRNLKLRKPQSGLALDPPLATTAAIKAASPTPTATNTDVLTPAPADFAAPRFTPTRSPTRA